MNKELEALWYFINRKSETLPDIEISDTEDNKQFMIIQNALTELEELKRYPTAEEVCEALSEHEKRNVIYSDKTHEFYYLEYEGKVGEYKQFITETYGDGLWSLGVYIPPHIITLIGRFYEGVEE